MIATGAVSSLTGAAGATVTAGAQDTGTFAGTTVAATGVSFNVPYGIAYDAGTNSLYVGDIANNKIRKITGLGGTVTVSSFTGPTNNTAGPVGFADSTTPSAATFAWPAGVATDGTNLYVADQSNQKIRQVSLATATSGAVSSFTGAANTAGAIGTSDGTVAAATFSNPQGISASGGNLYVMDWSGAIRKIAAGTVSSLAGARPGADGIGALANFNAPTSTTTDGINLYVADRNNSTIRKIVIATGSVTTLAGSAGGIGFKDGIGAAAIFNGPSGITTDGVNLYVADAGNNAIRKIAIATGSVTTLAGSALAGAVDGTGAAARFSYPSGITTDGVNLYVADQVNSTIRKIAIATGSVTTLAGSAGVRGAADGTGTAASFNLPIPGPGINLNIGITTDGVNLYVTDQGNNKIRKVVIATGVVSSVTGAASTAVAQGVLDGAAATARFSSPAGISTDGANLYVADWGNNKIRQIAIATGVVSSVTGWTNLTTAAGTVDGAGTAASFNGPGDVVTDGRSLYVSDSNNNTIRQIK